MHSCKPQGLRHLVSIEKRAMFANFCGIERRKVQDVGFRAL
jgi:hypothetical protein